MIKININDITKKAVDCWGVETQTRMAIEEMGELIVALSHLARERADFKDVAGEVADVEIMMEQLRYIIHQRCSTDLVQEMKDLKLKRLKRRLDKVEK